MLETLLHHCRKRSVSVKSAALVFFCIFLLMSPFAEQIWTSGIQRRKSLSEDFVFNRAYEAIMV